MSDISIWKRPQSAFVDSMVQGVLSARRSPASVRDTVTMPAPRPQSKPRDSLNVSSMVPCSGKSDATPFDRAYGGRHEGMDTKDHLSSSLVPMPTPEPTKLAKFQTPKSSGNNKKSKSKLSSRIIKRNKQAVSSSHSKALVSAKTASSTAIARRSAIRKENNQQIFHSDRHTNSSNTPSYLMPTRSSRSRRAPNSGKENDGSNSGVKRSERANKKTKTKTNNRKNKNNMFGSPTTERSWGAGHSEREKNLKKWIRSQEKAKKEKEHTKHAPNADTSSNKSQRTAQKSSTGVKSKSRNPILSTPQRQGERPVVPLLDLEEIKRCVDVNFNLNNITTNASVGLYATPLKSERERMDELNDSFQTLHAGNAGDEVFTPTAIDFSSPCKGIKSVRQRMPVNDVSDMPHMTNMKKKRNKNKNKKKNAHDDSPSTSPDRQHRVTHVSELSDPYLTQHEQHLQQQQQLSHREKVAGVGTDTRRAWASSYGAQFQSPSTRWIQMHREEHNRAAQRHNSDSTISLSHEHEHEQEYSHQQERNTNTPRPPHSSYAPASASASPSQQQRQQRVSPLDRHGGLRFDRLQYSAGPQSVAPHRNDIICQMSHASPAVQQRQKDAATALRTPKTKAKSIKSSWPPPSVYAQSYIDEESDDEEEEEEEEEEVETQIAYSEVPLTERNTDYYYNERVGVIEPRHSKSRRVSYRERSKEQIDQYNARVKMVEKMEKEHQKEYNTPPKTQNQNKSSGLWWMNNEYVPETNLASHRGRKQFDQYGHNASKSMGAILAWQK